MRIRVRVRANARKNEVTRLDETSYIVSVTAPPMEGKANARMIELLSEYFGKAKSRISIVQGMSRREKVIDIT